MMEILIKSKKEITLFALVDDENYEYLNQFNWFIKNGQNTTYAIRNDWSSGKNKSILMHREIMNINNSSILIDHIDCNGLNNQKNNLRICNKSENARNRMANCSSTLNSTSKYKGVSWDKRKNLWRSRIMIDYKEKFIGYFKDEVEAAKAYNEAALKYFGEFANLNLIEEVRYLQEELNK